jgi:hypothetical protein
MNCSIQVVPADSRCAGRPVWLAEKTVRGRAEWALNLVWWVPVPGRAPAFTTVITGDLVSVWGGQMLRDLE